MIGLLLLTAAAGASPLTLQLGEQATLTVRGNSVAASAATAAPLTAHDAETSKILTAEGCNAQNCGANSRPVMPSETKTEQTPAAPGTIRVTFGLVGDQSVLAFQNATDRLLTYRARITVRGQTQPTDVCQVLPLKAGYEQWPYYIERIELTAFELGSWDGSTAPRCE